MLVAAVMAITTAACSNDGDMLAGGKVPMTFSCTTNALTRADYVAYTGESFGINSSMYVAGRGQQYIDNAEVTENDGRWGTNPTYYWPKGDMHFAAYSPYRISASESPVKVITPGQRYEGYTFSGKINGRTNLMFADEQCGTLEQFTANAVGVVPIRFNHALTQVRFQARLSDGTPSNVSLKINSLYIRNVRLNGYVTFNHNGKNNYEEVVSAGDANKWNTEGMLWTTEKEFPPESRHDANYLGDHEVGCDGMSGIGTIFTEFNDCFYLMPQQLYTTGESQFVQQLEVSYTIATDGVDGLPKSVTVPLKTSDIKAWTVNKSVLYSLVVETGESLALTAAVQPWKLETFTNQFSEIVTVNADGKIVWTPGTCTVIDENVVLNNNIASPAEFTFTIAGPLGGTWQAIFVTKEGNPTAFTLSQTEGEVGKPCTVQVSANQVNNTTTANVAELRFVVRNAGALLPVDNLTTLPGGQNYSIVQNISLN